MLIKIKYLANRALSQSGFTAAELILVLITGSLVLDSFPNQQIESAETIHMIDQKIDDGNGGTGSMRVFYNTDRVPDIVNCVDSSGNYKLDAGPYICNFILYY